jgi:hypothetical protein
MEPDEARERWKWDRAREAADRAATTRPREKDLRFQPCVTCGRMTDARWCSRSCMAADHEIHDDYREEGDDE